MQKVTTNTLNYINTISFVDTCVNMAWSHTGVMDYDEACFMHLTPGVVHNFPKAVGV